MAVNLSPLFNDQTFAPDNLPASGYKIFTYVAGSTTKKATFTDSTGNVAHSNPIIINAAGYPPSAIFLSGNEPYKFVLAPPTDTDPPTSPILTRDNIFGINLNAQVTEWVTFGGTPTYISATSFSVVGDQTTIFTVGRRLRSTVTGGTAYSTITASSFGSGITTITVANDSTALDSGISLVEYGILDPTHQSIPVANLNLKSINMIGGPINEAQGANIASASTINLTTATGNSLHVTGTTTITAVTLAQGAVRFVTFDGALTLTNGASLILPTGANIVTAAGDTAVFIGEAAGVVRCYEYQRATGIPLTIGAASLAGNGYQRLPSGVIIQWGGTVNTGTSSSVTFPIAFPSAVASINITCESGNLAARGALASYANVTTSGFNWGSESNGAVNTTGGTVAMRWCAIGY